MNTPRKAIGITGQVADIVLDNELVDFEITDGNTTWRCTLRAKQMKATVTKDGLILNDEYMLTTRDPIAIRLEIVRLEKALEKAERKYQRDFLVAQIRALRWVLGEPEANL